MPISLSMSDIKRIANDAIRAEHAALEVVGVTFGEGGGKYTEVLLRVQGCQQNPCQVSFGVFRDVTEAVLREEIAQKVRQHVSEHQAAPAAP